MPTSLDVARHQWEEGNRRLEAHASDPRAYHTLLAQLEVVTQELRKRVGEKFTLDELVAVYDSADNWSREAVEDRVAAPGWPRQLSLVQDAAFHLYARGAMDYSP
jgi:hypothetical protein